MTKSIKPLTTVVNFILDNTGSMASIKDSTITGFNEYVSSLKQKTRKGKFLFTLTKFNSNLIETPYVATPIQKVEELDKNTYQPNGMTPLYDACVDTIESVAKKVEKMEGPVAVLTIIMTDGEENASQREDEQCLANLIGKLQKQGNWTFIFLGANQDSWEKAQRLGIHAGNAMNWQSTNIGTRSAMNIMAASTANYSVDMESMSMSLGDTGVINGSTLNTKNFFNKVDTSNKTK